MNLPRLFSCAALSEFLSLEPGFALGKSQIRRVVMPIIGVPSDGQQPETLSCLANVFGRATIVWDLSTCVEMSED